MENKNAQAWGFDLLTGFIIFIAGVILIYFYTINYPSAGEDAIQTLQNEGQILSETLLSEGSPPDWTSANVVRPGILSNGKINQTKLEQFALMDYSQTKSLFKIKDNYYIEFQDNITINGVEREGIGSPPPANAENLAKITRVVIYQNNITTFSFQIWN